MYINEEEIRVTRSIMQDKRGEAVGGGGGGGGEEGQ